MNDHKPEMFSGDESAEAFRIIAVLREQGFTAYLAGGCVRDALLGKRPKDYDVATDATPESIREVFGKKNTLAFGAAFGVIGVLPPRDAKTSSQQNVLPTEVATFRSDGDYSDGRRPDSVQFGDAKADAMRRDFTINGLFYDPIEQEVIDFVDGKADLKRGVLRTIGSAEARFGEDKLRMLRAIRFATTLGFKISLETFTAIRDHASEIHAVSGERIGAEMRRVMTSPNAWAGLRFLVDSELAPEIMPDLRGADMRNLERLLESLPERTFAGSLACVAIASDEGVVKRCTSSWKLSVEETRQARAAVSGFQTIVDAAEKPWSQVQPILINRDAAVIVDVAEAVAKTRGDSLAGIELARTALAWPADKLNPPMLLTGDDLRAAGYQAGPQFRVFLEAIRNAQLDGQITTAAEAWTMVGHMAGHSENDPAG